MTPTPERRGPEPLRDQIFIALIYSLITATTLAYALAPITDDLGPAQRLGLIVPLTPVILAALRWRARGARTRRSLRRLTPGR
jgi:hypothetical protein